MGRKPSGGGGAAAQTNNEVLTALLAVSPGQKLIATAFGTTVRIWDSRSETAVALKCDGSEGLPSLVRALAFSPDGATLLTASDDKLVRLWSTDGWTVRGSVLLPKKCSAVTFTPCGQWALMADKFGDVHVAQVSPDGRHILSGDRDNKLRVTWMPEKPNSGDGAFEVAAYCLGHTQFVACAAFCGDLIVSGGGDGSIRLWNISGELLDTAQLGVLEPAPTATTAEGEEGGDKNDEEEGEKVGQEEEGDEGCERTSGGAGRCEAVVALTSACDGGMVAALVEGRREVELWTVDANAGTLTHSQTIKLPAGLLPTSITFDEEHCLWVSGARSTESGGPGDMQVVIAKAVAGDSQFALSSDGSGSYSPSVLAALGGPAGGVESEEGCAGLAVAQLSSTLRKREFTEEEREKRKMGRADKKRKVDHVTAA